MKQIGTKKITGKIVVKTGLHIGAGNDEVHIGGVDMPIIRNPINGLPYIPGSSIKGKMRSLLEWNFDKVLINNGGPCNCGEKECKICRVFGTGNNDKNDSKRGPTRIIVRDAFITQDFTKEYFKGIIEIKAENTIDRLTAKATPRFLERVVPSVEFDFEIVYRVIDTGDGGSTDEKYFAEVVLEGLKLLQNDYLGGGGSRGNGQIEFKDLVDENRTKIEL